MALIGLVVAGCGGAGGAPTCVPEAECFVGAFFSECEGPGGTYFACDDQQGCGWFHGCVPAGASVSPCPTEDTCCVDGLPFAGDHAYDGTYLLDSYGASPWDRAREMNLTVAFDPALVQEPLHFECSGPRAQPQPGRSTQCDGSIVARPFIDLRDTLAITFEDKHLSGWRLWAEVDLERDLARLCVETYTDAYYRCDGFVEDEIPCAVSGTVVLSALPTADNLDALAGALDATLADGSRFVGRF
jgi:hypothetical protein